MPKYSTRAQKNHSSATEARSRPQRPGSLQEQPMDLMDVNELELYSDVSVLHP